MTAAMRRWLLVFGMVANDKVGGCLHVGFQKSIEQWACFTNYMPIFSHFGDPTLRIFGIAWPPVIPSVLTFEDVISDYPSFLTPLRPRKIWNLRKKPSERAPSYGIAGKGCSFSGWESLSSSEIQCSSGSLEERLSELSSRSKALGPWKKWPKTSKKQCL